MIKLITGDSGEGTFLIEVANFTKQQDNEIMTKMSTEIRGGVNAIECGKFRMVQCRLKDEYDTAIDLIDHLQVEYVHADVYVKESNESVTMMSSVDVPLCEDARIDFYDRPVGRFFGKVWTEPRYAGTFFHMDSVDDFFWTASTKKLLSVDEIKELMVEYLKQVPETGASEENWKEFFKNHGLDACNSNE